MPTPPTNHVKKFTKGVFCLWFLQIRWELCLLVCVMPSTTTHCVTFHSTTQNSTAVPEASCRAATLWFSWCADWCGTYDAGYREILCPVFKSSVLATLLIDHQTKGGSCDMCRLKGSFKFVELFLSPAPCHFLSLLLRVIFSYPSLFYQTSSFIALLSFSFFSLLPSHALAFLCSCHICPFQLTFSALVLLSSLYELCRTHAVFPRHEYIRCFS